MGTFTFYGQRNLKQNLQRLLNVTIDCNQQPQRDIKVGVVRNQYPQRVSKVEIFSNQRLQRNQKWLLIAINTSNEYQK